jgi:hypothetical protein
MRRPAVSISSVMGLIALVGVSLAAFRSPSQLWASITLSASVSMLTISILLAIYRCGRVRAFWVGFATCGWVYLVLTLGPWFEYRIGPALTTTALLDFMYLRTAPKGLFYANQGNRLVLAPSPPSEIWFQEAWREDDYILVLSSAAYRRIGHSIFALLAACAGGLITRSLSNPRREVVQATD